MMTGAVDRRKKYVVELSTSNFFILLSSTWLTSAFRVYDHETLDKNKGALGENKLNLTSTTNPGSM